MNCEEKKCCIQINCSGCCNGTETETEGNGGGNGIGVPVLTEPITKTIEISELQDEIDALPKILMADVTFDVNAGTYEGEILIERFMGTGVLTINGANAVGQTTHNISNMMIRYCNNARIVIQGFNSTTVTGNSFAAFYCPGVNIYFIYCNATVGANTTTELYGICILETHWAFIQDCKISNKYTAIRIYRARASAINLLGTNNKFIYNADKGGILHKENAGSITGTTVNSLYNGGLIVNPSGGTIGS